MLPIAKQKVGLEFFQVFLGSTVTCETNLALMEDKGIQNICSPTTLFSSKGTSTWIIDSGASDHMTGNRELFFNFLDSSSRSSIKTADGSFSPIKGSGSVLINDNLLLEDVLFVPNLACNLVSVSKLSKNLNCSLQFTESGYFL